MKKILFLQLLCFYFTSYSQNHQLIDTIDYKKHKLLIANFEAQNNNFNEKLKTEYKGKLRKEIVNIYVKYQNEFKDILQNKKLLFEEQFQTYLDSILDNFIRNNDALKDKNIKVFLTKNPAPNAFSIGNGSIMSNIGLFSILENDHQLLSVIAHEMAHEILQHSHKSILHQANLNISVFSNDSAFRRNLKLEKYNRGTKSFQKLKNLLYEEGELRRKHESEADSLGYLLYKKSDSPSMEFVNALLTLKKYDSVPSITLDSNIYLKAFNLPDLPFNEEWTKSESFETYNYDLFKDKIDSDSIKDHPEIENRITKLRSTFAELDAKSLKNEKIAASHTFIKLQNIANKAYVENLHYNNKYGLSIYLILKRLENNFEDTYLRKWLGINFKAIYEAKKKYQLNRYVDRIVPKEQSESYQQFLNFIWNLKLDEMKAITDFYFKYD